MNPSYFNPATPTSNFQGPNPLENYRPPAVKDQMQPAYFNPTLFDPFTFSAMSQQPFFQTFTSTFGTGTITSDQPVIQTPVIIGSYQSGVYSYQTTIDNTFTTFYSTQTYVYDVIYAPEANRAPVTFGSRFGTGVQTLYFSAQSYSETTITVQDVTVQTVDNFSTVVSTYYSPTQSSPWNYLTETDGPTQSATFGIFDNTSTIHSSILPPSSTGTIFRVESMFVDMLGSNVYQGLLGASNSIIIYQNEQVSSYYSQSLSYQVNITNLTAALESVSQTGTGYGTGAGTITLTNFSWVWTSSPGIGWTGSQSTYTYSETASSYLDSVWGITIPSSTVAAQNIQAQLTVEDNGLSNAQTFLNNAVTTLQSQVSLTGQIIASLSSLSQSITTNIASG